jgi:hypothetical protein
MSDGTETTPEAPAEINPEMATEPITEAVETGNAEAEKTEEKKKLKQTVEVKDVGPCKKHIKVAVDRAGLVFTNGTFCLSWVSTVNTPYAVEGKATLGQSSWAPVAGPIVATATNTTYCVPASNTNRFFRVVR